MDRSRRPAVSVITPAFNAAATIAHTITSCLAQTFPDFELVIVDDGSADGTGAIAAEYAAADPRVRLIRQANGGIASARNAALRVARGRYLALLDSDDLWMADYLETQVRTLDAHREIGVLSANALNMGGWADGLPLWADQQGLRALPLVDVIAHEDAVCIMSVFRREVYEAIGGFDERLATNEDYDYWLRAACAGFGLAAELRPLCFYRRRPNSMSADERRMLAGISAVLRKTRPMLPEGSTECGALDRQLARFHRERLMLDAKAALVDGNAARALAVIGEIPIRQRRARVWLMIGLGRAWPAALAWSYRLRQRMLAKAAAPATS